MTVSQKERTDIRHNMKQHTKILHFSENPFRQAECLIFGTEPYIALTCHVRTVINVRKRVFI
jgi:hypothetical protein